LIHQAPNEIAPTANLPEWSIMGLRLVASIFITSAVDARNILNIVLLEKIT
jgi:hypothetical protein